MGCRIVLLAPEVEEAAVAEGDVLGGVDAEAQSGAVDPFGGAFEFSEVADGGFVDDTVALAVGPLGAPFFIAEGGDETEGEEDCGKRIAIGDLGPGVGEAFVGDGPAAGIAADAQDFSAGAHLAVRSVIENIALETARG